MLNEVGLTQRFKVQHEDLKAVTTAAIHNSYRPEEVVERLATTACSEAAKACKVAGSCALRPRITSVSEHPVTGIDGEISCRQQVNDCAAVTQVPDATKRLAENINTIKVALEIPGPGFVR
jgi:hypothetical protein